MPILNSLQFESKPFKMCTERIKIGIAVPDLSEFELFSQILIF